MVEIEKGHSWQTQLKSRPMSLTKFPICNEKRLTESKYSKQSMKDVVYIQKSRGLHLGFPIQLYLKFLIT